MADEKIKWQHPQKTSYRNPNIGTYPDLEGTDKEMTVINGRLQGDYGAIRSDYRPLHIDSGADYGDYYSDLADYVNQSRTIKRIFSKRRNAHSSRGSDKNRPHRRLIRLIGEGGAVIILIMAIMSTLLLAEIKIQIALYIGLAIDILMTDALQYTGRVLALQSRVMISVTLGLITVSIFVGMHQFYIASSILAMIFGFAIKKLNRFWLDTENWYLSDNVERVLVNNSGDPDEDPDNNPIRIWENQGMREARTLCNQLGLEIDYLVLEGFCRPLVCLGISIVLRKLQDKKREVAKMEKEREEEREQARENEEQIAKYAEEVERIKKDVREFKQNRLAELMQQISDLKSANDMLRERICEKEDEKVPEEMIRELEDTKEQTDEKEEHYDWKEYVSLPYEKKEERDERARRLYKLNPELSVRAVQNMAGVPYETSRKLRLEVKDEVS